MNPRLQSLQEALRDLHLLGLVDNLRLAVRRVRTFGANRRFVRDHPGFALPPTEIAFDAHGSIDWTNYAASGSAIASRIVEEIQQTLGRPAECVVEWGCGPGRVIRQLPALLPGSRIVGTDYNVATIRWCREHLGGIQFHENGLNPPLPLTADSADVVYAISVVTHLSESVCREWVQELRRVLREGGLLMLWTNGDRIAENLLPREQMAYRSGRFVLRDKYEEGKKLFLSFHPPSWVRDTLLEGMDVVRHYPGGFRGDAQDVWVCRNRSS